MLKLVAAGGMFAASALVGLGAGVWLAGRTGQQLWVPGLLLAGIIVGGYSAIKMVLTGLK